MRQMLPLVPWKNECGVLNLGDITSNGTHWTCFVKTGGRKLYFDSFGSARPPLELVKYLGGEGLFFNEGRVQEFNDPPICGHLCLEVLHRNSLGENWEEILKKIRDDKYVWREWFSHK